MDDLVYHGSLVAFHKNQLDRRADDMPLNDTALYHLINAGVRDMDAIDKPLSRTGIFHVLFALFFSTLTNTILQISSYHPHHTRSKSISPAHSVHRYQENACIRTQDVATQRLYYNGQPISKQDGTQAL